MKIPKRDTVAMIDMALSHKIKTEPKRDYLGASQIGYECTRRIWYHCHKREIAEPHGPRIQRIFDLGNILEDYIVKILISTGMEIHDKDEQGEQFGFKDGKIKGHIDGVIKNIPESDKPHLLEIKTMNDSSFKATVKNGIKAQYPQYWVQAQVYALKMKLDKILFVVYNKNNSDLYQERMDLHKMQAKFFLDRAKQLAEDTRIPDRKYKTSSYYMCKFCPFSTHCWEL